MNAEAVARNLLERAADHRARTDAEPVLIVDASEVEACARAVLELHALRSLLAALPEDDWQPIDWTLFTLAQDEARSALAAEVSP